MPIEVRVFVKINGNFLYQFTSDCELKSISDDVFILENYLY